MKRTKVESSHVVSIGHECNELEVEFKGGKLYRYQGVPPELYRELLGSDSVGADLASKVIRKFPAKRHNTQEGRL